jgi:hypothetical protein
VVNTPAQNRRRLAQIRTEESRGQGNKRGADPDKVQPKGNPTFGRKDGYDPTKTTSFKKEVRRRMKASGRKYSQVRRELMKERGIEEPTTNSGGAK